MDDETFERIHSEMQAAKKADAEAAEQLRLAQLAPELIYALEAIEALTVEGGRINSLARAAIAAAKGGAE